MIKNLFVFLIVSGLLAGISACCKKRAYCSHEALNIAFTGFDRSQVRTLVLKRYSIGDKERRKAIDSAQYVNNSTITTQPGKPDTSRFSSYTITTGAPLNGVVYGFDYTIYFASMNKTYSITDIKEGDNRYQIVPCKDNDTKCANSINNYAIDGFWVAGTNTLYIKKQ